VGLGDADRIGTLIDYANEVDISAHAAWIQAQIDAL